LSRFLNTLKLDPKKETDKELKKARKHNGF